MCDGTIFRTLVDQLTSLDFESVFSARKVGTFLFGLVGALIMASHVGHAFNGTFDDKLENEFERCFARIEKQNNIPQEFKKLQASGDRQGLGVIRFSYDENTHIHLVNAVAHDYSQKDPELVAQKKLPHDLIVVPEDTSSLEFATLDDPRTRELAEKIRERFAVDTKRVGSQLLVFVDEMIVGAVEEDDRGGKPKLLPFTIPVGRHVSVVRENQSEEDSLSVNLVDHSNKAQIIDLSEAVAPAQSVTERFLEQVIAKNKTDLHFGDLPADFKQTYIQPKQFEKEKKERDLAEKELEKLNAELDRANNKPKKAVASDAAHESLNDRLWGATNKLKELNQQVEGKVPGGIKSVAYDEVSNAWLIEAEGNGYGPQLSSGLQGNTVASNGLHLHRLLVVSEDTQAVELLSTSDSSFKEYASMLKERNEEFSNIPTDVCLLFVDGEPVCEKREENAKGTTKLTPCSLRWDEHLSVITDGSDSRSDRLKIVAGTAPVKRLDLLDNDITYETVGAPSVTGGNGSVFATRVQQEVFVVLHGVGEHVGNFDKGQAYQTANIGIAKVETVNGRKQDVVPAQVIGVSTFSGGRTPGSVIVHSLLTDIRRQNVSPAYEDSRKYYASLETSSEDGKPASQHGSLAIQFDGNVVSTLYLGSSTWQESMEGPVKNLAYEPNVAALAMMQAMLHARRFATISGVIGKGTELDKVNEGGHTIGYFADDHINHVLQRDLGRHIPPNQSKVFVDTVNSIKKAMMQGWAVLDGREGGGGRKQANK